MFVLFLRHSFLPTPEMCPLSESQQRLLGAPSHLGEGRGDEAALCRGCGGPQLAGWWRGPHPLKSSAVCVPLPCLTPGNTSIGERMLQDGLYCSLPHNTEPHVPSAHQHVGISQNAFSSIPCPVNPSFLHSSHTPVESALLPPAGSYKLTNFLFLSSSTQ